MKYLFCLFAILSSSLLINPALAADAAELESGAAAELAQQLKSMRSMTANFHQQIADHRGSVLQKATGILKVKRPRRFYWLTQEPYEHLVVTNGKQLWLYDIDLEQITQQAFSADLDKAPALLLSGEIAEISQQYQVELVATEGQGKQYKLTPNSPDSLFKLLTIQFSGGMIAAMTLQDSFDQLTDIQFSDVKLNPVIDDTLFEFIAPEGIDVIRQQP